MVQVGQERNTLFLLLTSPVCIQAKFVDSQLIDTPQIRRAAKTPTKICRRKKSKAVKQKQPIMDSAIYELSKEALVCPDSTVVFFLTRNDGKRNS